MGRSRSSGASGSADENKPRARWKVTNRRNNTPNSIVYLTAAAAAKAAATALLTNQIVSGVSVTLFDGKQVTFKVAKCVIESDSVLCSVLGTHEVPLEVPNAPPLEVWVRVAWEQSLLPASSKPMPEVTPTVSIEETKNGQAELHWVSLESAVKEEAKLPLIPLLLYFTSVPNNAPKLAEIPRELIIGAVKEALEQVSIRRLEQGVKVIVSLSSESTASISVPPYVQTDFNKPNIPVFDNKLERLILALDPNVADTAALLCQGADEAWLSLSALQISTQTVLHELATRPNVKMVSLCGNFSTVSALADNNFTGLVSEKIREDFLNVLLFGRDLSPTILQSLKVVNTPNDLLHVVNRQRVGWLLDEICRLACINTRKLLPTLRIESIIFGNSGAILGRASLEPGVFQL